MNKLSSFALALVTLAAPLHAAAACGDGLIDGTDACDDGNVVAGDGCSATCTVEMGFDCRTQTHVAIANGSFEVDPLGAGGGWTLGPAPASIDWVDGTSFPSPVAPSGCLPAGEGRFSVDMNGTSRGQLFQDVPTTVGTRYTVTLLGDANCVAFAGDPCNLTCSKQLTISVSDPADATHTPFDVSVYLLNGGSVVVPWQRVRYEFVARSAMTRLAFTGSEPSNAGPMVDGIAIPASICDPTACGDGVVGTGEMCDDGNRTSGDGCSASCQIERGYTCPTAGTACTAERCGDGLVAGAEACDDGNNTMGDGCSGTCTIEPGWSCAIDPFTNLSVCAMRCGNGTIEAGEQCDDHNTVDQDACSNTCLLGPGELCLFDSECALGACGPSACLGCYDTAPPGGVDFNCTSGVRACDTSGPRPICVGCVADGDCPAGNVCNAGHACDPAPDTGVRADAGTDAAMTPDAGADAGPRDAGAIDAGSDAGPDAAMPFDGGVDAGPRMGGASGGACTCSLHARTRGAAWQILAGLALAAVVVRRRRTR